MNRWLCLLATVGLLPAAAALSLRGAEPTPPGAARSPNAAVVYWQAFAALPTLEGEQKTKYEAAIKSLTEPLPNDVQPIAARFDTALRVLHRARGVAVCDWNLSYDDGPELLLPHLQKARDLSRAALLRARLRFAAQAIPDALADVVAVLKLAHDCGASPLLVSLLVDASIENLATEVLATNLTGLTPRQLDDLAATLQTLPATCSLVDCLRLEGQLFGDWIERFVEAEAAKLKDPQAGGKILELLFQGLLSDAAPNAATEAEAAERRQLLDSATVAEVRESVRWLRADYAESAAIAALRPAERRARWPEFEAKFAAARKSTTRADRLRALSCACLPAIVKVADREDQLHVRRQLLRLAIQVQGHGPGRLQGAAIPEHGPVAYRPADGGFELRCQPASADKPEVLRVGAVQHQPAAAP